VISVPAEVTAGVLGILGYMYPTSALTGKIKKRTREIRSAPPGTLDLLTISMEAGLSLDMAIMKVSESDESILGAEFQKVLNEVSLAGPAPTRLSGWVNATTSRS
jgi:tight adherence protein C